jgi:hypothetical protein
MDHHGSERKGPNRPNVALDCKMIDFNRLLISCLDARLHW